MNYSSKHAELEIFQERITSQIGRDNFSTLATPVTDIVSANRKVRRADSLVLALNPSITDTAAQLSYLTTLTNRQKDTCEAYWYHTDHLGSSSWITDSAGNAIQHLHYLPWGEDFVDQRTTSFNSMFTFSAKERDAETGLSYFGSRYYSSDLSIWLSVDPQASKYPSLSPYVYCANNSIKLVDPEGEEWYVNQDGYIVEGTNKKDHTLYAVEGKEKIIGDKLTYQAGDRKGQEISMPIDDEIMKSFKTDENGYSQMDLTGKEKSGLKMMRFFSRYTDVEWSFWGGNSWDENSKKESAYATIGTSHSYNTDKGSTNRILNASIIRNKKHTIPLKFFIHTHPHQETWGTWASGDDKMIKESCTIGSPSAQFGIMHGGILYDYGNNKIKLTF